MLSYSEICRKVEVVARRAGEFIAAERENFSFDKVEFKGAHNLVSYVDKGAEKIIVEYLRELLPEAGFITEEGTATCTDEHLKWIIDPLDGTTNFVHGLPPYCVSIALMEGDEVVVGVVYEVTLGEMFTAWKGSQAFCNGKPIEVSKVREMSNALIAVGFSYSALADDSYLERVANYQRTTDGIRRLGSATADLVYVAKGRVDAFSQIRLKAWDVAAGVLIAQRAGAIVTDYSGGNDYIFGGEIVAANPYIHGEFLKSVR